MKTDLSIKAAIYLRAAELVEQGFSKHCLFRNDKNEQIDYRDMQSATKFCYRGAIMRARYEINGELPKLPTGDWENVGPVELAHWNNAPDTTAAMVAQKLREQAFA